MELFQRNIALLIKNLFKIIPFNINSFIFNLITQNLFTI
ncbi:MAG: hypothetical protein RLZZ306_1021, partial [Bacteroidota bacterium]